MAFRSSGKRRRTGCVATLSFISGIETSQKIPLSDQSRPRLFGGSMPQTCGVGQPWQSLLYSGPGFERLFLWRLRAQNRPVVQSAITVLLDPSPRVHLQPFQPHARDAGIEKALLEVSGIA